MADPTLYLYTSLTAGSSHIITATSRLETILKANKIPFRALDCATDEKARTLWSRRSRGRKLPGLVKFGQVIGDYEQVEEWNEFGELHDQIDSADDFLDASAAPANPNTITLRPEPGPGVANSLTPIQPAPGRKPDQTATSNASSRASSEARHISISEPTAKNREARSPLATPSENPMTLAMRQLGAEAAAKAKVAQRKMSAAVTQATPAEVSASTTAAASSVPTSAKEREISEPSKDPDVTAAKTPAQLAAEGAKRTSVDKIESTTRATSAFPTSARATTAEVTEEVSQPAESSPGKSTEEQVLDLRRQSTQVDQPSKLHESILAEPDESGKVQDVASKLATEEDAAKQDTAVDDVESPTAEAMSENDNANTSLEPQTSAASEKEISAPKDGDTIEEPAESTEAPKTDTILFTSPFVDSDKPIVPVISPDAKAATPAKPRSHRGSSVEAVDKSEIEKIEEQNKIEEHPGEDEAAVIEDFNPIAAKHSEESAQAVKTMADAPEPVAGSAIEKPQDTAVKDPTAAAKPVED